MSMDRRRVAALFKALSADNPTPKTELRYGNAFQLLVAVILSAQATDVGVNRATEALFLSVKTPADMLVLGEERLRRHIRTIGLFNTKARNIMETSRLLVANHGGKVPGEREALEALPGVGRKTANVVLNVAFGQPTMAVDTHIFRVANRTGLAPGRTPLQVEQGLLAAIPARYLGHAHHWLILHGRYVCTARKPHCDACVIARWCDWAQAARA